jgi:undecaprenyl diphosphate synthase
MPSKAAPEKRAPTMPRHIAVVMDGNGRWAKARTLPRQAGHHAGVKTVRAMVQACANRKVEVLTLFAFSSENWQRPREEVGMLMQLFLDALDREIAELHKNGIRIRFIGQRGALQTALQERMRAAEALTEKNAGLTVIIAVAYGGRWDIAQAARILAGRCAAGELKVESIDEARLAEHLQLFGVPSPDLFIRTGGEQRISNFLLWDLAYTEFYFCDVLWPDFDERELDSAISSFNARQRRYGLTPEQAGTH